MIEHVWTVICSRVVVDQESNNLSIQNVLERVTIPGEPIPETLVPMPFEVVTMLTRADREEPVRGSMRMQMLFPSGKVFDTREADIAMTRHTTYRVRNRFSGLPIAEAGRHVFTVELRNAGEEQWRQVAAVPLMILLKPPEEESTVGEPKVLGESESV
jgi:hypothetical protein